VINDVQLIWFCQNLDNCDKSDFCGLGNSTQFVEYLFKLSKSDCVDQHRP